MARSAAELLASHPILGGFDATQLDRLAKLGEVESFAIDEEVVREGTLGDSLYLILAGRAAVFAGRAARALATLETGEFFGEMSLVEPASRSATVRAAEGLVVFRLPHIAVARLAEEEPRIMNRLLVQVVRTLSQRLRRTNNLVGSVERLSEWLAGTMLLIRGTTALLVLGLGSAHAAEPDLAALPQPTELAVRASALSAGLVELRRDLHMHPELSNREVRTCALVAARLRALGLEVKDHVAKNGVVAILRGGRPGPVVALRADLDALPIDEPPGKPYRSQNAGVKHACGHDVHTAIAIGVAELLVPLRDRLPGTVKFIFQPAEEGAPAGERGGSALMIEEGVLEAPRPVAIFGLHVLPTLSVGEVALRSGPTMAVADRFVATVLGKTHGAYPHDGIDAVAVAAEAVTALQTIRSRRIDTLEPMVLTIGRIQGGNRFNIIADEVQLEGTIRVLDETVRKRVHALMREILGGVTAAHGARYKLEIEELAPLTENEPALTVRVKRSLERALGPGKVGEVQRQMGAEDFGYFQRKIPGVFFFLGVGNRDKGITAMIHTPAFDVDEGAIDVGVRAMTEVVLGELTRR